MAIVYVPIPCSFSYFQLTKQITEPTFYGNLISLYKALEISKRNFIPKGNFAAFILGF